MFLNDEEDSTLNFYIHSTISLWLEKFCNFNSFPNQRKSLFPTESTQINSNNLQNLGRYWLSALSQIITKAFCGTYFASSFNNFVVQFPNHVFKLGCLAVN